jgi:N-acetylmuramoyl-L-alanine amidase
MQNNPDYLIIHTAAHEGDNYDIEDIDEWHRERGWQMVGYHYFICKDGTIQQGRPDDLHGAHCLDGGMNTKSLGICFQGHGDREAWTRNQELSFQRLAAQKRAKYGIPVENVQGHRRYATKTCPGTQINMEEVRALYSSAQGIERIKKVEPAQLVELPTGELTDFDLAP